MDESNILLGGKAHPCPDHHQHHHHHDDRKRKRHCMVFLLFLFIVLFSYLICLGTSFGIEQKNSLMHHNQIINSSIIINIIVKGGHGKRDTFDDPMELLLPTILQDAFAEDQGQQFIPDGLLEPDMGRLRVDDRYHRVYFGPVPTDAPETSSEASTDAPTEASAWF